MEEHNKLMLRDFLAENWSAWLSFCEQRGEDPEEVYVAELDGEPE